MRSRLSGKIAIASSILLAFRALHAREPDSLAAGAVDAKGVRHLAREYHEKSPPWNLDIAEWVGPQYSARDRMSHNQGTGLFRLTLDLRTGAVTNVTVTESTGIRTLDQSALTALRQWRWKPGKWKEVDIPISFGMAAGPPQLPPGAVRLPNP